jgi:hypothetical protein
VRSAAPHARLSLAGAAVRRVVVLLIACPNCGILKASWNGRPTRTVNLTSPVREKRLVTVAAFPSVRRGRLELEAVSARAVTVEGVGIGKV